MLVSSGLKSFTVGSKASSAVTVPPSCLKKLPNPEVRPWVYGHPSFIVAAVVILSSLYTKSATTLVWITSFWAVRKYHWLWIPWAVSFGDVFEEDTRMMPLLPRIVSATPRAELEQVVPTTAAMV